MTIKIIALILLAALVTATISGIFGMAGGLIFMGVIASFMGVAEAMVVHGAVQSISNSYRAYLLKGHVRWDIFVKICIGAVPALALLVLLRYVPSKGVLFMVLGLLPILLWLPKNWISLDAQKPAHAVFLGFCVTGLNLVAGVAGPALDMFFVKTKMPRHEIVATKSHHNVCIAFNENFLFRHSDADGCEARWLAALVVLRRCRAVYYDWYICRNPHIKPHEQCRFSQLHQISGQRYWRGLCISRRGIAGLVIKIGFNYQGAGGVGISLLRSNSTRNIRFSRRIS